MNRVAGWRFLDIGRRLERAHQHLPLRARISAWSRRRAADFDVLLDLIDSQITYRSRYLVGVAPDPVRDMALLDPFNPRSVAFQIERLAEHIATLPVLNDSTACWRRRSRDRHRAHRRSHDQGRGLRSPRISCSRSNSGCSASPTPSPRAISCRAPMRRRRKSGAARVIYDIRHVTTYATSRRSAYSLCALRLRPTSRAGQTRHRRARRHRPAGRPSACGATAFFGNRFEIVRIESEHRELARHGAGRASPCLARRRRWRRRSGRMCARTPSPPSDLGPQSPAHFIYAEPLRHARRAGRRLCAREFSGRAARFLKARST